MANVIRSTKEISQTWTFFDGEWREGNTPIMGVRTHATWAASTVFDGARAFDGVAPDLEAHLARVNVSAQNFLLKPVVSLDAWIHLALEGISRFEKNANLYVRPMYWADSHIGSGGGVRFDPESTQWCMCVYVAPLPKPLGVSVTLSPFRRPSLETAPVDAKAGCLYPNNARALIEAFHRGFDNCLMLDMLGNVTELANANVFMAKGGVAYTPAANGCFLSGITRGRVIKLLRAAGIEVVEKTLRYADFLAADEIFSTGNFAKVAPVTRIDDRSLTPGPIYQKARDTYWQYAHDCEKLDQKLAGLSALALGGGGTAQKSRR